MTRTFASKARTMSFTFGTLSMLILLSLLCLNFSGINKGIYKAGIEMTAPFDVHIFEEAQVYDDFDEFVNAVDEDYTINKTIVYDVYKEPEHQMQDCYGVQFFDFDPVMKLSDYNEIRKLKNMDTIEAGNDGYILITSRDLLYKVENNPDIEKIRLTGGKELNLKDIDTKTWWYQINNTGNFTVVVPDEYVQGLEIFERHLIIDTAEETDAQLREKIRRDMKHRFVTVNEEGQTVVQYNRLSVRGSVMEEQNSATAMIAGISLYIAFILISAVGTVLAVQSLSDSTKYSYRYRTLKRLGVNDTSLFATVRKQLLILFGVPVICSVPASFFMLEAVNDVYKIYLGSGYRYLIYFVTGLAIFFLIYGIYWIAAYIGFRRNINEES